MSCQRYHSLPTDNLPQLIEARRNQKDYDERSTDRHSLPYTRERTGDDSGYIETTARLLIGQLAPFMPFSRPHLKHFDRKSGAMKSTMIEPSQFQM